MPWREPNEQREPSSLLEWQSREEEDKVKWSDLFQSLLAHNSIMADLGLYSIVGGVGGSMVMEAKLLQVAIRYRHFTCYKCKHNHFFAYVLLFQKPEIRRCFQSWTTMGAYTRFSWHGIFTLLNICRKSFLPQRT